MDILLILRALRRNKVGAILIGLQIALTLAIVCNSLSAIEQFVARMQRPTGIDEPNIFTLASAWISDPADLEAKIKGDLAALRGLPGVVDATAVVSYPLDGYSYGSGITLTPDQRAPTIAATYFADEHGLAAFGLKLIAGRWFHADEVGLLRYYENKYPPTIVVTRDLANTLFPSGNALGQVVYLNLQSARIVGVIERAQTPNAANGIGQQSERSVFVPMLPMNKSTQYVVRTRPGQLGMMMRAAESKLFDLDSHRIIQRVTPFSESRHTAYLLPRTFAIMLAVVSVLLLTVTGLGVVGLTTYWVSQRRRQIGMRRALGARRADILSYFHTENLVIVGIGCIVGIALGLAVNTVMAGSMQMERMSAGYVCLGALIVLALCQMAVLWPALRAASITPATATRGL